MKKRLPPLEKYPGVPERQTQELSHLIARQRAVTITFDSDRFEGATRQVLPLGLQPLGDLLATARISVLRASSNPVFNIEQRRAKRGPIVDLVMVESNQAEERLARVEHMLAQCRRESAALKVMAASKVVVVVVEAASPLNTKHAVRPARPKPLRH